MSAASEQALAAPRISTPRAEPAPASLTDEQRELVLAYFAEHKNGGYKAACRAAGMAQITRAEARALLHSDEEIREARFKAMGLDEPRLFELLGSIAGDGEHKDQFRAVTWGLNAIHRWAETNRSEHTGADGGPMEVADSHVADALDRFTSEVRRLGERAESDRGVRDPGGERAALPPGGIRG